MDSEPIHIVEIRESPAGRRCENCYFYDAWYYDHETSQRMRGDFGDCKRFPPVQRALISNADGSTSGTMDIMKWPSVDDTDWCGEFREIPSA